MKKFLLFVWLAVPLTTMNAQKEFFISQYMLSQYSVNTAFGGSHEALSLLGSFRKSWMGMEKTPGSQFFSAHTPLKNDHVALGIEFFAQQYAVTNQNGFVGSYTYRIRTSAKSRLAFSLSGGYSFNHTNWTKVRTIQGNDPNFDSNDKTQCPVMGFGMAWYGQRFFSGFSVPNFFDANLSTTGEGEFAPGNASYLFSGGYLFKVSDQFDFQPSGMIRLNDFFDDVYDVNGSLIWKETLWLGLSYRSTGQWVGLMAFQALPQLRVAYCYEYQGGEIGSYNSGSHEISLQFDFGYRVKTANPKFF